MFYSLFDISVHTCSTYLKHQNTIVNRIDDVLLLYICDARKCEQAHIPHAPTLPEIAVYNEWHFQALVTGNRTENQFHLSCTK